MMNPRHRIYATMIATFAISLGLQMIIPFPYGLIVSLVVVMSVPILLKRQYMNNGRGYSGGLFGSSSTHKDSAVVRYVCLVCQNRHKGGDYPRCGSKMQRADF